MQIFPLSEGAFTVGKTKAFIPFVPGKDDLQKREAGSILVEIQPFVVTTKNDVLLLDTGLGFEHDGELQLHRLMSAAGIDPGSVTKVLMSHLHKDHAGGVSKKDSLGHYEAAFANATYYVQQHELQFAFDTGFPSYMTDEVAILNNNKNVQLLNGSGYIDNYIKYEITGGHSPYHQAFWIEEDGETIFFGGDEAPQLQQMKSKFVAKYDYDGKRAMQLRQQWRQEGQEQGWTFLFYHDIRTPAYKF